MIKKKGKIVSRRKKGEAFSQTELEFIRLYLETDNLTEAARSAGYGERAASTQGSRLLRTVRIRNEIDRRRLELSKVVEEKYKITKESLTRDLIYIRDLSMQNEKPADALKAIELLGKSIAMFQDKVQISQGAKPIKQVLQELNDEQ